MDDNKKSTTIWLRPSVISRMDGWLKADNCRSRNEFVEKALRFYMGYLSTDVFCSMKGHFWLRCFA